MQALTARQYAKGKPTALNDDLVAALQFFIDLPKRIPFFEPYAWSTRDVFHSLPGAAPGDSG